MGKHKLVITTGPKTFCLDLPKDAGSSLKHEIFSMIKHNEFSPERTIKTRLDNYWVNIIAEIMFMSTDLRSLNKYVALQNLSNYYTWGNIRQKQ